MSEVLYGPRAGLYDTIYAWKDYVAEGERLHGLLAERGIADGARVAEVACGTGKHLAELRRWYTVAGADLSPDMLAIARQRLPGVPLACQDMRAPLPGAPVDALFCLFSSIGYLHGPAALAEALGTFAAALRPGGVLVLEPWIDPADFRDGHVFAQHTDAAPLYVTRMSSGRREGDLSVIDFHWLVGREGQGVEHFVETHALWLCPRDTFGAALATAGFDAEYLPDGLSPRRGLWVARRG
jgi:daunosaminyl-N,N-dimethyltransferase/N-dimethyltransferase